MPSTPSFPVTHLDFKYAARISGRFRGGFAARSAEI